MGCQHRLLAVGITQTATHHTIDNIMGWTPFDNQVYYERMGCMHQISVGHGAATIGVFVVLSGDQKGQKGH